MLGFSSADLRSSLFWGAHERSRGLLDSCGPSKVEYDAKCWNSKHLLYILDICLEFSDPRRPTWQWLEMVQKKKFDTASSVSPECLTMLALPFLAGCRAALYERTLAFERKNKSRRQPEIHFSFAEAIDQVAFHAAKIPGRLYELQRKLQRSTTEMYATAVWIRCILCLVFVNKALHFMFTKHSRIGIALCKLLDAQRHFLWLFLPYVYLPDEFL